MQKNNDQLITSNYLYRDVEDFCEQNKLWKLEAYKNFAVQIGAVKDNGGGWDYGNQEFFSGFLGENPDYRIKKDYALAIIDTQRRWGRTLAIPVPALKPGMVIFNFQTGTSSSESWGFRRVLHVGQSIIEEDNLPQPCLPDIEVAQRQDWDIYLKKFQSNERLNYLKEKAKFDYNIVSLPIDEGQPLTETRHHLFLMRVCLDEPKFIDSLEVPDLGVVHLKRQFWNLKRNLIQEVKSIQSIQNGWSTVFTLEGKDESGNYHHDRCLISELCNKAHYEPYTNQNVLPLELSINLKTNKLLFNLKITSTSRELEICSTESLTQSKFRPREYHSLGICQYLDSNAIWIPIAMYLGVAARDSKISNPFWDRDSFYRSSVFGIKPLSSTVRESPVSIEAIKTLKVLAEIGIAITENSEQFFELIIQMAVTKSKECLKSFNPSTELVLVILNHLYEQIISNNS